MHAQVRAHSSRNSSLEAAGVPRQSPTDAKRPVGVISLIGGYGGTPSRDHFSGRGRNGKAMSRLGAPPTWPLRLAREALDLLAGVVFFSGTRKSGKQPVGIAAAIAEFTLRDLGIIELAQPRIGLAIEEGEEGIALAARHRRYLMQRAAGKDHGAAMRRAIAAGAEFREGEIAAS